MEEQRCSKCKEIKPLLEFRSGQNRNKKSSWCRLCQVAETKAWRKRERLISLEKYGPNCKCCGESTYEFLSIDHINGGGKVHRVSEKGHRKGIISGWLKKNGYPPGFQVLCHNCNMAKGVYGICPHQRSLEGDNGLHKVKETSD